VDMVRDELECLGSLLRKLEKIEPNLSNFERKRLILPPLLGDLSKPELKDSLRAKNLAIEDLERDLIEGAIGWDDYCALVKRIVSES